MGVASGGRLFGLPLPPEITVGVWSFLTLKKKVSIKLFFENMTEKPLESTRLRSTKVRIF